MSTSYLSEILPLKSEETVFENEEYQFKILKCVSSDGKYNFLITDGLRSFEQNVNEDNTDYRRLELYFCLPDYWNLENKSWPIHWLNRIAQVPKKNDTWFGLGDTIPAGNPPEELEEGFKANHFILFAPEFISEFSANNHNENFNFLAVVPLFQKEIDYKLKNSHSMLRKKFTNKGLNERLDIYREDVSRRKMFGKF